DAAMTLACELLSGASAAAAVAMRLLPPHIVCANIAGVAEVAQSTTDGKGRTGGIIGGGRGTPGWREVRAFASRRLWLGPACPHRGCLSASSVVLHPVRGG